MIIVPQTPITENSFNKWKCHRLEVEDGIDSYHYYIIPLIVYQFKLLKKSLSIEIPKCFYKNCVIG